MQYLWIIIRWPKKICIKNCMKKQNSYKTNGIHLIVSFGVCNGFLCFSIFAWDKKIDNILKNITNIFLQGMCFYILFMLLKMIKELVELSLRGWCIECLIRYYVHIGRERRVCVSKTRVLKILLYLLEEQEFSA